MHHMYPPVEYLLLGVVSSSPQRSDTKVRGCVDPLSIWSTGTTPMHSFQPPYCLGDRYASIPDLAHPYSRVGKPYWSCLSEKGNVRKPYFHHYPTLPSILRTSTVFLYTLDDDAVVTTVFQPTIIKFVLVSFLSHTLIHFSAHSHSMLGRSTGVLARSVSLSRNAYYCCE